MTITDRPSVSTSALGGSERTEPRTCRHAAPRTVIPWRGEDGTAGTVVVVGAGKMGLPLATQYALHGWSVTAVDVNPAVVESINAGQSHVAEEPGLAELVAEVHRAGRLRATTDGTGAAETADVIVLIVPVMLDDAQQPDYAWMDAAVDAVGPGIRPGSTVIFETTLPVGDTRRRFVPMLERLSSLAADRDFFVAFSPERLYTGNVFRNLAAYPKLVGGIGAASTDRAARFYASVLDAEVVAMASAESAELAKLAETTYRDVNIAFATELAHYAESVGVDIHEVIRAANSQPYSHIHEPGIGVGGHCIPVYPHFLLARAPDLAITRLARETNDGQVGHAVRRLELAIGPLAGVRVLVVGLTYRAGVKELAYSRGMALVAQLADAGAHVVAHDPLLTADEVRAVGAEPWTWGATDAARVIVAQTDDAGFGRIDARWFPELEVVYDGRRALRSAEWPRHVTVLGVGLPPPPGSGLRRVS